MAILSDFFVASPEQAARYANRLDEPDGGTEVRALLRPASYTGFTTLQIGKSWAILEGVAWDRKRHLLENIWFSEEGDAWLNRFPDELTRLLAGASGNELAALLAKWAATDEVDYSEEDLAPVLRDLGALARKAVEADASVYLWGCV
jgi:hypothetical protein